METHFEILIDASGSMGFMKGSKEHEDEYLLPDQKSTRTDLVKKILIESLLNNLSFVEILEISSFRNSYNFDAKGNRKKSYKWEVNKEGVKEYVWYYPMPHKLHPVYKDGYNKESIITAVNSIKNPEIGGTPLWWALSVTIHKPVNKLNILILSDGDANDKENFDEEILSLIKEKKKDCTIHFIGIAQDDVALKKSKNLAEKTGGIYTNLKALNYDKDALNVLLSKLNTTIVAKALDDNIKETQSIAAISIIEKPKIEGREKIVEDKKVLAEEKAAAAETDSTVLEKQVHKNTTSLEYISSQLNNILSLLHSNDQIEDDVVVVENKIHNERIGRSAEEYLYEKLQELFKRDSIKVTWLNENGEQGKPYDFLVENDKDTFYYECKGSASDLNEFQLTKNEWDFYLENKGKYRLCYVKNVDSIPQYGRFMDLLKDMESRQLIPCAKQNKAYKANRVVFTINNSKIAWI
ncbi:protein NO VEIN domain-containing protein [Winogradskyella helgolandensis]|uniref:protein NO VEIN domain-containing protein n=1 Tax=Winogradskyella helgolandensis TaxID=2697010 RepID=UPI0015CCBC8C|nr:DUF3883 domain-containing protein [Winogradskyella helgolandensis]